MTAYLFYRPTRLGCSLWGYVPLAAAVLCTHIQPTIPRSAHDAVAAETRAILRFILVVIAAQLCALLFESPETYVLMVVYV